MQFDEGILFRSSTTTSAIPSLNAEFTPRPRAIDLSNLPVVGYLDQIIDTVQKNPITIIEAETGSGKSTLVAQALMKAGYKTVVTQPRILAARDLATVVSAVNGTELGDEIGYRSSQERNDSRHTRLLYVTDGLQLVRELFRHAGNRDVLVLDEVHDWNTNIEVLAAWARKEIANGAKFKLVVMSATLDVEKSREFFGGHNQLAPAISVPGRLFQVETQERGQSIEADAIRLLAEGRNVILFQPGKRAIERSIRLIKATGNQCGYFATSCRSND